jgi:hypothetical protein
MKGGAISNTKGHRKLRDAKSLLNDPIFANKENNMSRGSIVNKSIASFAYTLCRLSIRQKMKSRKQNLY